MVIVLNIRLFLFDEKRFMLLFSDLFLEGIKLFFPEIFLSLTILVLLLYGVFLTTSRNYNYPLITKNIYFYLLMVVALT